DYVPPERVAAIQTRKQAESALQTSYSATQQIWKEWHAQYLLSLREQHRKWMNSSRSSKSAPHVGAIVLLVDPIQSRNEWKLARITAIHRGDDNAVREVCLLTATGRTIKRPVNLIIPLELDCDFVDQESDPPLQSDYQAPLVQNRYNLRKRLPTSILRKESFYEVPTLISSDSTEKSRAVQFEKVRKRNLICKCYYVFQSFDQ
ncbi:hypothetical protein OSTOST_01679, partial [Ostertagia ostertagi]